MSDLANKKCVPCEGNIPPFNAEEIHKYLKKVDGWEVLEDKIDGFHLIKSFKFDNFLKSQEFVNKVGEIAESEGHHPDLWAGLRHGACAYGRARAGGNTGGYGPHGPCPETGLAGPRA